MPDKKKVIDTLPDTFVSAEAAGEFWDGHSLADHQDQLESADISFDLQERVFEVRVAEDMFNKLQSEAEAHHQSIPKTVDRILRKELLAA